MVTFELAGSTREQRDLLRQTGYSLEFIELGFYNVSIKDEDCDTLTDLLDERGIKYRMV